MITDWAAGRKDLKVATLEGWKLHSQELIQSFSWIRFTHIFREHNSQADSLSKEALSLPAGALHVSDDWEGMPSNLDVTLLF